MFVDDPRIPLDNNYGERLIRNPAVGRKNYYGSGAEWAGRLAMMMFSIFATLVLWKINPRKWLSWYFDACAANGGKAPDNPASFLPWNLSEARLTGTEKCNGAPDASNTSIAQPSNFPSFLPPIPSWMDSKADPVSTSDQVAPRLGRIFTHRKPDVQPVFA